jgi:hypothetical protein
VENHGIHGIHGIHGKEAVFSRVLRVFRDFSIYASKYPPASDSGFRISNLGLPSCFELRASELISCYARTPYPPAPSAPPHPRARG